MNRSTVRPRWLARQSERSVESRTTVDHCSKSRLKGMLKGSRQRARVEIESDALSTDD